MILAAHQPAFLPWLGYLHKMAIADVFVVMDDLQYEAQNFQNRNRVKLNSGAGWLTVPVERGSQSDSILQKRIQNGGNPKQHWQRRAWITLKTHYGRASYFSDYAEELEDVFTRPWNSLFELDWHMLTLARRWLGITTPVLRSSELALIGQRSERIVDMCRKVGAHSYLSGSGGSSGYLELEAFAEAGLAVAWQQFRHPLHQQRYPELGFISHLGFIDLLCNCGPQSRDILFATAAPRATTQHLEASS